MTSVSTTGLVTGRKVEAPPFSLIEYKGLFSRLVDELKRAVREFAQDPKAFIRELVKGDTRDARRRRLLYSGILVAFVVHAAFLTIVAIAGWHRFMAPVAPTKENVIWVPVTPAPPSGVETSPTGEGTKSKGDKDGQGGGGGDRNPKPAQNGVKPQFVPQPQLVAIDSKPAPNPAMAIPATLVGPVSPPPPPKPVGDPSSKGTENSAGPGTGGGLGDGKGTGVGPGSGPGAGRGSGGGPGNNINEGSPNGDGTPREVQWGRQYPTGLVPLRWLFRPTPVTTPDAQAHKVFGTVLLRATFKADGTVSDIEVLNQVEYMTESAIDALKRSKFKPATLNGKPITMVRVPIRIEVHY